MFLHQLLSRVEGLLELVGAAHPDRLAAETFGNRDVVDAVAGFRIARRIDVVESERDFEVHVEAALGLADEAEIRVVHDDMQVGQLVLGADGQFLDHELEIVVTRERDDLAVRIGGANTERCRQRPAERAGLAAVDPVARLVDVQELRAGDLGKTDGRDVASVAVEGLVHLFIDALRLQRHLVEMRLAQHGPLAR